MFKKQGIVFAFLVGIWVTGSLAQLRVVDEVDNPLNFFLALGC